MINDIINAIAIKLNESFPNHTVYVDKVPQNFQTPSFLIQLVSMVTDREIGTKTAGRRWKVSPLFNIQYFPEEDNLDMFTKSLDITLALEEIELINGDIILARGMNNVTSDDILNNFMRFDFYLLDRELKDFMETLKTTTKVKGVFI